MCGCCGDVREILLLLKEQNAILAQIRDGFAESTELAAQLKQSTADLSAAVAANKAPIVPPVKL